MKVVAPTSMLPGKSYEIGGLRFAPTRYQYNGLSKIVSADIYIYDVSSDFSSHIPKGVRSVSVDQMMSYQQYRTGTIELNDEADLIEVDS